MTVPCPGETFKKIGCYTRLNKTHSIIVKLFLWFVCLYSKTLSVWWNGLWSGNLVGKKEKDQVKNQSTWYSLTVRLLFSHKPLRWSTCPKQLQITSINTSCWTIAKYLCSAPCKWCFFVEWTSALPVYLERHMMPCPSWEGGSVWRHYRMEPLLHWCHPHSQRKWPQKV